MKILFLDIDGVLNTGTFCHHFGSDSMDPLLVRNLMGVLFRTGCRVVVSSDWRLPCRGGTLGILAALTCDRFQPSTPPEWVRLFQDRLVGCTADLPPSGDPVADRTAEILAWLEDEETLQVDGWAVVDDLPLNLPNFVRTSDEIGLTEEKADQLVSVLLGQ